MEAEVAGSAWSWRKWLAAGLAAASATAWLVYIVTNMSDSLTVAEVARDLLGLLLQVAVPAIGVWLTARRDGPGVSLGLAVIAAWGAIYHLVPQSAPVVASALGPLFRLVGVHVVGSPAGPLTYVLGTAAFVAALLAPRGRTGPIWIPAAPRIVAAAAIAVWAVTVAVVPLTREALSSQAVGGLGPSLSASTVAGFLVLLVIAAVVWRGDSLTAVGAAAVVGIGALVRVLTSALAELTARPPPVEAPSSVMEGAIIAVGVQAVAAVAVVAASAHLARVTYASWRSQ